MFLKSPPPLVLASTSPYRRALLERLGVPFECAAPGVDETPRPGETAARLVARLAREKAEAVARRRPDACVVGSDQVAVLDGDGGERLLGKPGTAARCIDALAECSGRTVRYLTAVAVRMHRLEPDGGREFLDTTCVRFRTLARAEIERYVAREAPLDCAGGIKSEGLGIALCTAIESSDPTALIGLPLIGVAEALRAAGYPIV